MTMTKKLLATFFGGALCAILADPAQAMQRVLASNRPTFMRTMNLVKPTWHRQQMNFHTAPVAMSAPIDSVERKTFLEALRTNEYGLCINPVRSFEPQEITFFAPCLGSGKGGPLEFEKLELTFSWKPHWGSGVEKLGNFDDSCQEYGFSSDYLKSGGDFGNFLSFFYHFRNSRRDKIDFLKEHLKRNSVTGHEIKRLSILTRHIMYDMLEYMGVPVPNKLEYLDGSVEPLYFREEKPFHYTPISQIRQLSVLGLRWKNLYSQNKGGGFEKLLYDGSVKEINFDPLGYLVQTDALSDFDALYDLFVTYPHLTDSLKQSEEFYCFQQWYKLIKGNENLIRNLSGDYEDFKLLEKRFQTQKIEQIGDLILKETKKYEDSRAGKMEHKNHYECFPIYRPFPFVVTRNAKVLTECFKQEEQRLNEERTKRLESLKRIKKIQEADYQERLDAFRKWENDQKKALEAKKESTNQVLNSQNKGKTPTLDYSPNKKKEDDHRTGAVDGFYDGVSDALLVNAIMHIPTHIGKVVTHTTAGSSSDGHRINSDTSTQPSSGYSGSADHSSHDDHDDHWD